MAHRSQCSSFGGVDGETGQIPPHYKEYYRLAVDALAEDGLEAYHRFLASEKEVDFLCSTEVEHICRNLKKPRLLAVGQDQLDSGQGYLHTLPPGYHDSDSSGTYWPEHTDIAAPVLDLGWPSGHPLRGPSDVTIFVHPPAPDTLSIKEEVRRLIRSATQVIAIVMDVFTDIDLFDEVLEAASREIPVYLLLDEMQSHHFLNMVKKCNVNLSNVHFLRVRTLVGSTYYCRSGLSFTGNLIERFLLVDTNAVLCGSYSFMWSFEKIHRSIVQRFQGELVGIFDEEFRILYAQSLPLEGLENEVPAMDNYYSVAPYSRVQRGRPRRGTHILQDDILSQHSSLSWAESDPERFPRIVRQEGQGAQFREGAGIRNYGRQLPSFQQEPVCSSVLRAKRMEMDVLKRRSYAEGTAESYDSRECRYEWMSEHRDQLDTRSDHVFREKEPGVTRERFRSMNSKHRLFERFQQGRQDFRWAEEPAHGHEQMNYEDAFLSGYPLQPPLSNCSREVRYGSSDMELEGEGRLGLEIPKRPNIGQSYACQKSPTQKQVLDPRMLFQESGLGRKSQDQPTKLGLRRWRLGSYLSDQPGLPEGDHSSAGHSEGPGDTHTGRELCDTPLIRDPPQFTSYKLMDLYSSKLQRVEVCEGVMEQGEGEQVMKLAKHASLRSKLNPLQQRGSRLRSSLIFNSSKIEQHMTQKSRKVLSIREQVQDEARECQEQKPLPAGIPEDTADEELRSHIQGPENVQGTPAETVAPGQTEPEQGQSCMDINPNIHHRERAKFDLQLSKKVQEVLNKMAQRTSAAKVVVPQHTDHPQNQPVVSSSTLTTKPSPQPPEADTNPPPPTGPQHPPTISVTREAPGPTEGHKRPSPTPIVEEGAVKVRLHSTTVCVNGQGSEDGKHPAAPTTPKVSPKQRNFFNFPGDRRSREIPGQGAASGETEKGGEQSLRATVEREEKLQRSAAVPGAVPVTKATAPASSGRYGTSANVLYSTNLRDDTKVILEQISANSLKNREGARKEVAMAVGTKPEVARAEIATVEVAGSEGTKPQPAPASREQGPSGTAPADGGNSAVASKPCVDVPEKAKETPSPADHTDPLIRRIDSFRKERRVYSRFEVFYKRDEPPKAEGNLSGQQDSKDTDGADKKRPSRFIPKLLGTFRRF
ncbi:protein FAM83H-like [Leucoraja erinacea]|uniref:protein FAM83H-like n=1 Tax=Leucoraja erinaceus TaxID=7782 RepID=UPI002454B2FF|nr:protein FAM83H-like [Leucoraja erinacea]